MNRLDLDKLKNLNTIDFNKIYSAFLKTQLNIKISYLTADEIYQVKNFPIKEEMRSFELSPRILKQLKDNNGICLVVLNGEHGKAKYHEAHIKDLVPQILNEISGLEHAHLYYFNRKMAAVTSGLGQYGKNQLVYNKDFGFHHSIWTFAIFNPVINLPIRNIPKYSYMDICTDCNECIKHCPAQAIHGDEYPGWLDKGICQGFFQFGNHPIIPSTKYGINLFLGKPFSDEQLEAVHDQASFEQLFGFENTEGKIHYNGKTYRVDMHFCRECMNQLPCRKRSYSYDKNYHKVVNERPYEPDAFI